LIVLATVALVVTAGVVGGVALDCYLDPFDDRPFDPVAWAAAHEDEQERGPMARDAIRHLPAGLSSARVRELLGEGQIIPAGGDRWGVQPRQSETWSYWLGCWSGLGPYGFDSAFLYVHFGPDGRVVGAEITGG
jgi:hypothetical protein